MKFHDYGIYINVVVSQYVVQRGRSGISLVRRTERYLAAVSRGAAVQISVPVDAAVSLGGISLHTAGDGQVARKTAYPSPIN